ncbi:carbohydrate kinase family protein [Streptomyces sp. SID4946]|uniref:carbohydrate kinase family protein n=1 Tax=Streptomyces TaxID=1883 RepID=UPI00081E72A9|nr:MULTISPECIES: carbohydrate kinase family protein [unclassified Streptomyces]MYQ91929.1 carbohydrate kinase family protein [Streptomyces sp. SID4946]SCF70983.1 adenosine kinase [Streptomyces sp. DconLS]SCG03141.1 adenosine kinase [Streptomyces sp. LamerLS-31b]
MHIAVTGSIATDHLMVYPGRFADQLIKGSLDKVSLSFLADELKIRRGGVAANIAYGLARLGLRPILVGAAGRDFAEYRERLEAAGVDADSVLISRTRHTARFVCTTDADQNQIATFYAGAMSEARELRLAPVAERVGGLDLVVIAPDDPEAMLRHTDECRALGFSFAADPSQQLARLDRRATRRLLAGAEFLLTNEYEAELLKQRSGWTEAQVLSRLGTWITTRGAEGVRIARAGAEPLAVPAVTADRVVDPTGVGDAFRAGFFAGHSRGWPMTHAVRLGCALATEVLGAVGSQEYDVSATELMRRVEPSPAGAS